MLPKFDELDSLYKRAEKLERDLDLPTSRDVIIKRKLGRNMRYIFLVMIALPIPLLALFIFDVVESTTYFNDHFYSYAIFIVFPFFFVLVFGLNLFGINSYKEKLQENRLALYPFPIQKEMKRYLMKSLTELFLMVVAFSYVVYLENNPFITIPFIIATPLIFFVSYFHFLFENFTFRQRNIIEAAISDGNEMSVILEF